MNNISAVLLNQENIAQSTFCFIYHFRECPVPAFQRAFPEIPDDTTDVKIYLPRFMKKKKKVSRKPVVLFFNGNTFDPFALYDFGRQTVITVID
jgi:hypothetical protein